MRAIWLGRAPRSNEKAAAPGLMIRGKRPKQSGLRSVGREGDDAVSALVVELGVAARADDDVLLAVDHVGRGRRVHARARLELPELFAVRRVVGLERAIALAREHEAAGGGEDAADHRLRRLHLPGDLAGVVVDRGDVAGLDSARDVGERAAEPELAVRIG